MSVAKYSLIDLVAVNNGMAYYTNIKGVAVRKDGISMYFHAGEIEFATGECGFNFGLLAAAPTRDGRPPFLIVSKEPYQSVKYSGEFSRVDGLEIKDVGFSLFGAGALTIEIRRQPAPFQGVTVLMDGFLEDASRIEIDEKNKGLIIENKTDWYFGPCTPQHDNPEWNGRYREGELVPVDKLMERKLEMVLLVAEDLPLRLSESAKKYLKKEGGE
jgi:hypothetical protein